MIIIDGRKIAGKILENLKKQVAVLPFVPEFCDVLVGNDPASAQYVKMKANTAQKVGIKFVPANFSEHISTEELVEEVKKIGQKKNICGLIVQLPLPVSIDRQKVLNAVLPEIDVDCTGEINSNLFYSQKSFLQFPTALAILEVLKSLNIKLQEKKFFVLGQGQLVGKPVTHLLSLNGYRVKSVHKDSLDFYSELAESDVVISATGKPNSVLANLVKKGSIVIDAGTSELDGGIVGDVNFKEVSQIAYAISPVPGGVGPVTVAKLLENVVKVAVLKSNKS